MKLKIPETVLIEQVCSIGSLGLYLFVIEQILGCRSDLRIKLIEGVKIY